MAQMFDFPTVLRTDRSIVEADFRRFDCRSAPDPLFHFSVVARGDWTLADDSAGVPTEAGEIVTLARLAAVQEPAGAIDVLACRLAREIPSAAWLRAFAQSTGWDIVAGRAVPSVFGAVGDLLATREVAGTTVVARMLAIKDGNRLYALVCRTESFFYPALADAFLLAVQSFSLLAPSKEIYAEPMHSIGNLEPAGGAFLLPQSWAVEVEEAPAAATALAFKNLRDGALLGQINLLSLPAALETSAEALAATYLGSLTDAGVAMAPGPLQPAETVLEEVEGAWSGQFAGTLRGVAVESRCTVIKHPSAWVLLAVFGPGSDADAEAYAVNLRAYEIATSTFKF